MAVDSCSQNTERRTTEILFGLHREQSMDNELSTLLEVGWIRMDKDGLGWIRMD